MNETINVIKNHRSIRAYSEKEVTPDVLEAILKAAQAMPTSINGQQVSVIVIRDKEKQKKLAELTGGQPWVEAAPVFLVFVADLYKTHLAAEKNGKTQVIHESLEGMLASTFDGGLAMGGAIVAAESLGLGIVPIGGIRYNPEAVIELLNLPKYTFPLAGLGIGYPENSSKQKPRLPLETFAHEGEYKTEELKANIDKYDSEMETYLKEIGREKEGNWSSNTSEVYQRVYYPKVYPVAKEQGFSNDK